MIDRQSVMEAVEEMLPRQKGQAVNRERNPVQVKGFWDAVRDTLRVVDDEMYSDDYVPENERMTGWPEKPLDNDPFDDCKKVVRSRIM